MFRNFIAKATKQRFVFALLAPAAVLLASLAIPTLAQGYVDPPVKLGLESEHIGDTTGLIAENSPREIPGLEVTGAAATEYAAQVASSPDFNAAVSSGLDSELSAMLQGTKAWSWELAPELALAGASGWVGWEIGGAIWGTFFGEASPSTEGTTIFDDRWYVTEPGELLLSSSGSGEIYAPDWGFRGTNHFFSGTGRITDTKECEIEVYGDGMRLYLPEWTFSPGCGFNEYRNYVLWRPLTIVKCGVTESCEGIETTPYEGANQPAAPSAEELETSIETELKTESYPIFNRFLNEEEDPADFPDPRVTQKKVDDEERRCDRGAPAFENPGGSVSPEPFAKKEESAFTIKSLPEGVESPSPVYLRWGKTYWRPGKENFEGTPYLDDWPGWGYRHIVAKHGWNALDREETELALMTPQVPKKEGPDLYRYSTLDPGEGIGGVECERRVFVAFETGINPETEEEDPAPRGIVSSFNAVK